jgi:protein-S-isoprenylcysteine O-methyltransferase Ste14
MNPKWAEENLQTIRTLMERSALYRRALAPIMLLAGSLGVAAAATGLLCHLDSAQAFGVLWLGAAVIAVAGALLIARRQALKDKEVFWSPPTRRVTQALIPPLLAGLFLGALEICDGSGGEIVSVNLFIIWVLFYGCAFHSAGFFMPRGIRYFGWLFIVSGCLFLYFLSNYFSDSLTISMHWLMGFFFGVMHLIYGAYLYLTEKKNSSA